MATIYVILIIAGTVLGTKFSHNYGNRYSRLYVILGMLLILTGLCGFLFRVESSTIARDFNHDADVVQKLLLGEGVPIEEVRPISHYLNVARDQLKVPKEILKKLAEPARYSLRFDTNEVAQATANR